MKRGQTVFENENGKAVFEWTKENGQPMHRIFFNDGKELWTNSMDIIKDELTRKRKVAESTPQLTLF